MKQAGTEFEEMLRADRRNERRLLWGEIVILAAVLMALGVRFWLLKH